MITHNNFHLGTEATFKACKKPKREPDYVSNSGSSYWYGEDSVGKYVIRASDHWVTRFSNDKIQKCKHLRNIDSKGNSFDRDFQVPNLQQDCAKIASCMWYIFCPKGIEMELYSTRNGHRYFYSPFNKKDMSTRFRVKKIICGKCYLKDFKPL